MYQVNNRSKAYIDRKAILIKPRGKAPAAMLISSEDRLKAQIEHKRWALFLQLIT